MVNAMEMVERSHIGKVRKLNQDRVAIHNQLGILVLADGMGGHVAGEVASELAVETTMSELIPAQREDSADELESQLRIGQAVETANEALLAKVERYPKLKGMGTTIVAAIFRGDRIFYAHVGDSRLYRLRSGRIRRLTKDHSLVQQMIDNGVFKTKSEANRAGIGDNVLTRSLGHIRSVEVDVSDSQLEPEDIYLSCSDGLCGKVPDAQISRIMRDAGDNLERMADDLLNAALNSGGNDNISIILARSRQISL